MARFGQFEFADGAERAAAVKKIIAKAKALEVDSAGFEAAHGGGRSDRAGDRPADATCVPPTGCYVQAHMNLEQALAAMAAATSEVAREKTRADSLERERDQHRVDADKAIGKLGPLEDKVRALEAFRTDADKVGPLQTELDAAKAELDTERRARLDAQDPKRIQAAVAKRANIEIAAREVLGTEARMDEMSDRDVMAAVVSKLRGKRVDAADSVERVESTFEVVVQDFRANATAQAQVRTAYNANRVDAVGKPPSQRPEESAASPYAWPKPLPNSREGRRAAMNSKES